VNVKNGNDKNVNDKNENFKKESWNANDKNYKNLKGVPTQLALSVPARDGYRVAMESNKPDTWIVPGALDITAPATATWLVHVQARNRSVSNHKLIIPLIMLSRPIQILC